MAAALQKYYAAFQRNFYLCVRLFHKRSCHFTSFVAKEPLPDSLKHLDGAFFVRSVIKEPFFYSSRRDSFARKKALNNLVREQNIITPRLCTCL